MWSSSFLILGLASAFVKAQNPPNLANSTVPYDLPKTQKYDYSEVLHKSLLFYHAQRSGALGSNRRLAWRGDSCFICTGPHGEDLSGGYYEAANTMKWGLPLAYTITQLAFNVHVFGDAMKAVNQLQEAREGVKWGSDYLLNCITDSENFVGQFGVSAKGKTDIDFGYFGPAEEYEKWVPLGIQRPEGIAYINSSHPSSEILGESAAALAATSVIYFSVDQAYSTRCLEAAKDLYNRGSTNLGTYMTSKDPNMQTLKEWYPSSIYTDELGWAASWLYVATKDSKYLDAANGWIAKSSDHSNEYSWDEKLPGIYALLFMETKNATYKAGLENFMDDYLPGGSVKQTALGLSFYEAWGSLGYAASTAFLMMTYSKIVGYNTEMSQKVITFSAQQLNYMLGDCGRSWVVGFGEKSPIRPYHKSSYNSFIDYPLRGSDNGKQGDDFLNSDTPNRFILYGALGGGPKWDDTYLDNRAHYEYTDKSSSSPTLFVFSTNDWFLSFAQVTQDYNAAFTGLNAAMIDYYGTSNFKAFTDCGLNLGWSHPNATNPPNWPSNDCYHTCNTGCTATDVTTSEGNKTTGTTGNNGTSSSSASSINIGGSFSLVALLTMLGAVTSF